ncbi:MAG: hypothetical protein V4722_27540 [Bacteroidota bacterium]
MIVNILKSFFHEIRHLLIYRQMNSHSRKIFPIHNPETFNSFFGFVQQVFVQHLEGREVKFLKLDFSLWQELATKMKRSAMGQDEDWFQNISAPG